MKYRKKKKKKKKKIGSFTILTCWFCRRREPLMVKRSRTYSSSLWFRCSNNCYRSNGSIILLGDEEDELLDAILVEG